MSKLLDVLYFLALCITLPYFIIRAFWDPYFYQKKVMPRLRPLPSRSRRKPCLWVHGVSVGEVLAVDNFVNSLEKELPGYEVVISTTTTTGYGVALKTFPDKGVFYYPLDFSGMVRRAFERVHPTVVLLVELEVWPNFLEVARSMEIPVMVINGRITEKSFGRYSKLPPFFRKVFQNVSRYCVQSPEYAQRFKKLGVSPENIRITGNLKYDNAFTGDPGELEEEMLQSLTLDRDCDIIIGGSTHPGEEEILVDIFQELKKDFPSLQLILAPRHPRRVPEIVKMIRSKGEDVILRSSIPKKERSLANLKKKIILIDTIGELSKIYAVASVVFVGGSLIPRGGHNMLEPAALGKPILVGPYTDNFKKIVDFLNSHRAIEIVPDGTSLMEKIRFYLGDEEARRNLAKRAKASIEESTGATKITLEEVKKLLS